MAVDPASHRLCRHEGDAVYKSYDGGQRWASMRAGLGNYTISSVVNQFIFDPLDSQHILLATTMGVYESKTAGKGVVEADGWDEGSVDGHHLGDGSGPPFRTLRGTSGGVYKSTDQAGHWEKVNNGLVPLRTW
ncbi:MAG: hypothetical protein U0231_09430 [Nitrospiraceae bacterium]